MKRQPYSYATLRFVHDIATGEFLTVGVAVYSASAKFLKFKFRRTLGVAGEIFDSHQLSSFRALMRTVRDRAASIEATQCDQLQLGAAVSLETLLLELFPKDASALQWTSVQQGLTADLACTSDRLFARYCAKYDRRPVRRGVSDKDAWSSFHRKLEDRRIARYFQPKVIGGQNDEITFNLAWKNGVWHCIEPVSFDLADPDAIRTKAHTRAGEIVGIRDSAEEFSVYFVVTPPEEASLQDAFERAKGILTNSPLPVEVYEAGQEDALLERMRDRIAAHN
ncbi:DUF3037 domain-containing protein [Bordetella genomosp. 1]|uniref:DUF3037 domain-containing protein n=1 Tax=Bordetella genomosp. 1 TaxID=1395607 RepID=A0ABX4EU73_9BORD|nr:DUF3037 domain-containing protein [Bordetella genomosp. 1]OZI57268.1 hypothetical protein CAL27_23825 [Bordetella genomosp. 1]